MQTVQNLEEGIQVLKREVGDRRKKVEDPKNDLDLRKIRKELKRKQRRRRNLLAQTGEKKAAVKTETKGEAKAKAEVKEEAKEEKKEAGEKG